MSFFSQLFQSQSAVKQISASALQQLLEKGENLQLLDVRTAQEFKQGQLPKAINIDVFSSEFVKLCQAQLNSSTPILVCCRSGQRSMNAARKLENAGFTTLYNLKGGLMAWSRL